MLEEMLKNVREKSPLIHNITNYVTVNDCANVVLACGASPIMADDQEEVAEIEEVMRKTIADLVSEASGVACWVYVQKYVKHKPLDDMLQEWSEASQFILAMDTWFERLMVE